MRNLQYINDIKSQKLCPKLPIIKTIFFSIILITISQIVYCQDQEVDDKATIYTFQIREMIAPGAFRTVSKAVDEAEEINADYIILELNTYGGLVDAADSIRTKLMRSSVPTIAWVNNNAASAGALISIACDSIYMTSGANIGASTVVSGTGEEAPDKYQSYMRSTMRSTAEAKGRDPQIAEAMVDDRIEIEGITKEGEVITFTTSEAIQHGFCEEQEESLKGIIENQLQIEHYKIVRYKKDFADKVIAFLLNPIVSSVLMFMMVGGIWFELQSPGVGFPLIAAIIGAVLYFMPLYLEGLAENWEILLFVVGVLLLLAEVFVIPGFGVAGILGIIALVVSLTFSLIHNTDFEFSPKGLDVITIPLIRVILTMIALVAATLLLVPVLFKNSGFRKLALETEASKERGFTVLQKGLIDLVGKHGLVVNELKPIGRIEIDGEYYSARSVGGWVDFGEEVRVIQVDVNNLVVRKVEK